MAEELIYKVGVEGTNELDKLEKSVDKAGKSTGKTKLYMSELRNELRKARGDMIKYAEGTEEYNRALEKGARITQQINDSSAKMKTGVRDLGVTTQQVASTLSGFAGGFQVVQATMSLFGVENEETIKTILRLQQTMSIAQGLATFAQGIGDARNILSSFRENSEQTVQVAAGLSGSMNKAGESMEGASESAEGLSDNVVEVSSNLAGATNAADETSKGMTKLTTSLSESGGFFDRYKESVAKVNMAMLENDLAILKSGEDFESLNAVTNKVIEANGGHEKSIESIITAMEKEIALNKSTIEGLNQKTESLEKTTKATDNLSKGANKSVKAFVSLIKNIGRSLLTMAAFLIVIWAVTEAISAIVTWLSKVPESVKIKLEIEEDVQNQLDKERLEARKFANDLQLLHRKVNKENKEADIERLKRIREQGKEEMGLTDTQLDNIAIVKDDWFDMFDAYLLKAEYTYKKEALMKKKIDAETRRDLEKTSAEMKFNEGKRESDGRLGVNEADLGYTFKELEEISENTGLKRWFTETFTVWKDGQQVVDHLREATRIETEELAVINQVIANLDEELSGVDFGTGKTKGNKPTTTPTTSPGKAPTFGDRRPDSVEDDAEIKFMEARNVLAKELTNEEMVILAENIRLKDQYQSDSELRYTEYQIRLAQARAKDLENQRAYLEETLSETEANYAEELESANIALDAKTTQHNEELAKLREYNQTKFDMEAQAQTLLEQRQGLDGKKDADKIKAIDDEIEALNGLYKANNDNIANSKKAIAGYKEEKAALEERLKALDTAPEEIARIKDAIIDLNLAIADNSRLLVATLADNMQAMMDNVGRYTQEIGIIFNDLENMSNAQMQTADNRTAKEKNNLELSQAYREADSEHQQQMMYELDLANYNSKKKAFEANKRFQMGQVVIQSASNQIDIVKAWLDPKTGGPLSPANIAIAAAATATNIATTIASLRQISSTSLDKPVPPTSGSGGGSGSANIALNPHKTSLTSREENLNSMYRSSRGEPENTIVKVSEINNVQKRVQVREKNSSY